MYIQLPIKDLKLDVSDQTLSSSLRPLGHTSVIHYEVDLPFTEMLKPNVLENPTRFSSLPLQPVCYCLCCYTGSRAAVSRMSCCHHPGHPLQLMSDGYSFSQTPRATRLFSHKIQSLVKPARPPPPRLPSTFASPVPRSLPPTRSSS